MSLLPCAADQVKKLKGADGRRKLISYTSIGEAETYRFYWKDGWVTPAPT